MVRTAVDADADRVAEILHGARATMTYLPQDLHTPDDTRRFVRLVLLPHQTVLVAEQDKSIVGFAAREGDMLTQLYVAPGHFGQGIGAALLDEVMAQSPGGLRLWVFEPNVGAIRFYRRRGFRTVVMGDGSGNEEGVPDRLMAWNAES